MEYAGSFQLENRNRRGYCLSKCHIGLFVCQGTKAAFIFNLSLEAFIPTLRQFVSRRCKPSKILFDNGLVGF